MEAELQKYVIPDISEIIKDYVVVVERRYRPDTVGRISKYPRYKKKDILRYIDILKDEDYLKWSSGINPKTNRKIKIGKKTHTRVGEEYGFNWLFYNRKTFNKIIDRGIDKYLKKTKEIRKKERKQNKLNVEYDKKIEEDLKIINEIDNWNDYHLSIDGVFYGCRIVSHNIHMENNCKGLLQIIHNSAIDEECNRCADSIWKCGRDCDYISYQRRCSNCDFSFRK